MDQVFINTKFKALQNCRVYRSMEMDTDHRVVLATVTIKLKPHIRNFVKIFAMILAD